MTEAVPRSSSPLGVALVLGLVAVALLFLPLGLAIAEEIAFNTHHVEEACRVVGIHGFLRTIYEAVGIH